MKENELRCPKCGRSIDPQYWRIRKILGINSDPCRNCRKISNIQLSIKEQNK